MRAKLQSRKKRMPIFRESVCVFACLGILSIDKMRNIMQNSFFLIDRIKEIVYNIT